MYYFALIEYYAVAWNALLFICTNIFHITQPWASQGFFQGSGQKWIFPEVDIKIFPEGGQKWCNFIFPSRN